MKVLVVLVASLLVASAAPQTGSARPEELAGVKTAASVPPTTAAAGVAELPDHLRFGNQQARFLHDQAEHRYLGHQHPLSFLSEAERSQHYLRHPHDRSVYSFDKSGFPYDRSVYSSYDKSGFPYDRSVYASYDKSGFPYDRSVYSYKGAHPYDRSVLPLDKSVYSHDKSVYPYHRTGYYPTDKSVYDKSVFGYDKSVYGYDKSVYPYHRTGYYPADRSGYKSEVYRTQEGAAEILEQDSQMVEPGHYLFRYKTNNGIEVAEQAALKSQGPEAVESVQGTYSWVAPNGEKFAVEYVADETGYHPKGAHIPEIPVAILRSLEWNAAHPDPEAHKYDREYY